MLELTDVQAILTSLIENIQRKDLTLEERVKTYQVLQQLDPEYRSHRSLAKVTGLSHRQIGEDFQAYEIQLRLQPHGIRVESDFPPTSPERQRGEVLPKYHAVLLHQASSSRRAKAAVPDAVFDADLAKLAREIAPHSQDEAKEILALMQSAVDYMDKLVGQEPLPPQLTSPQQHAPFEERLPGVTGGQHAGMGDTDAAVVTCASCGEELTLIHEEDGTHQLVREFVHPQNQLSLPGLSP